MMHRAGSSTIKLLLSPSPTSSSAAAAAGGKAACFHVSEGWEEGGVDVGTIGRALGLEPASVRLNGYLLGTRGPDHVAASVTWRSLLAFFAARGLPTGKGGGGGCGAQGAGVSAADGPIVVQGRPASPGSLPGDHNLSGELRGSYYHLDCTDGCHRGGGGGTPCCKRKVASEGESPLKKEKSSRRITSALREGEDDVVSDSVLCMRKKLRLDDEVPPERAAADPGPICLSGCTPITGSASNCVVGHRKRSREDELAVALPCKRAA